MLAEPLVLLEPIPGDGGKGIYTTINPLLDRERPRAWARPDPIVGLGPYLKGKRSTALAE